MVLTIDIGNSNINVGGYGEGGLLFNSRIHTDAAKTEFEYAAIIREILVLYGREKDEISGAIVASVVPQLSSVMQAAVALLGQKRTLVVGAGMKTGLNIRIDSPGQLGADLLATAVGAMEKYPLPVIIVDLGTATKLTVVDRERSFLGGAIMPGVRIGLDALSERTAQLPHIALEGSVEKLIGANTVDSMRSGVVLGTAAMIDGMTERYRALVGEDATVVACGGLVGAIAPHCKCHLVRDDSLLLDGLYTLYRKNA